MSDPPSYTPNDPSLPKRKIPSSVAPSPDARSNERGLGRKGYKVNKTSARWRVLFCFLASIYVYIFAVAAYIIYLYWSFPQRDPILESMKLFVVGFSIEMVYRLFEIARIAQWTHGRVNVILGIAMVFGKKDLYVAFGKVKLKVYQYLCMHGLSDMILCTFCGCSIAAIITLPDTVSATFKICAGVGNVNVIVAMAIVMTVVVVTVGTVVVVTAVVVVAMTLTLMAVVILIVMTCVAVIIVTLAVVIVVIIVTALATVVGTVVGTVGIVVLTVVIVVIMVTAVIVVNVVTAVAVLTVEAGVAILIVIVVIWTAISHNEDIHLLLLLIDSTFFFVL
ncbi:8549_t:CDS:2 [Paraglomus brasilianum]|uniref:8549_t:CDS:1 n=1 Tax=Paraglomus brasilianum TaxID=144538 RepID=A0A9N9ASZ6_9GLOM|nr:8549_t:CDS:2 [Paraglomus brasilianum]